MMRIVCSDIITLILFLKLQYPVVNDFLFYLYKDFDFIHWYSMFFTYEVNWFVWFDIATYHLVMLKIEDFSNFSVINYTIVI